MLPYLPEDGQPPDPRLTCIVYHYDPKNPDPPVTEGSQAYRVQKWKTALRLLGVSTGSTPPPQPLREAAEAEVRRLTALHEELSQDPLARTDCDMALFDASPELQLLHRYRAAAERELHRSVDGLMKLRKNSELFARSDPEETIPEETPAEPEPSEPKPARKRVRRTMPPERNEAIYESWEVKRAGAENLGRELPHIPLAVGVGRSGPSQTTPAVPVRALPTHIP